MVQAAITKLLKAAVQDGPFASGSDHLPADLGTLPLLCIGARSGSAPEAEEGGEILGGPVDLEALAVTPAAVTPQTGVWGGSAGASRALGALFEVAGKKGFAVLRWRQYEAVWGGREVFVSAVILRTNVTL